MTSKIKVDNINKVSDDSNIINKCGTTVTVGAASDGVRTGADNLQAADGGNLISQSGTTITLGASGDTITLASGASQTGFGRTGTVDWQTSSIKTATFTAANGEGYFADTSSGGFTMNLPSSPSAGSIVSVKDYANTFDTNNLTVGRGGSNIGGLAQDAALATEGVAVTFVYVDATKGWLVIQEGAQSDAPQPLFTAASGGTTNDVGDFRYHVFTGPGTFQVTQVGNSPSVPTGGPTNMCFMVVAGGGGGQENSGRGAGGGGGIRSATCSPLSVQTYPVTIGGGGAVSTTVAVAGCNGSPSTFNSVTSAGGGGGGAGWTGSGNAPSDEQGQQGGSGGGGGARYSAGGGSGASPGGLGNQPPVSPPQGAGGGNGNSNNALPTMSAGGGGGGGPGDGACGTNSGGGNGGAGRDMRPIFGPAQPWYLSSPDTGYYAGGGGGGTYHGIPAGSGGIGGGGDGENSCGGATDGAANSGGGGGGSSVGGSGIVVIKYKFQ
jgi:hypothetical protein